MTEKGYLLSPSTFAKTGKVVNQVLGTLPPMTIKRRRVYDGSTSTTGGSGGKGGGACCCAEMDCIQAPPGVADEDLEPAYYSFDAGVCQCFNNGNKIKLYKVGSDWESKHGSTDYQDLCQYPECKASRDWKWVGGAWVPDGPIRGASCGTPAVPDYDGTSENQPATTYYEPPPELGWWKMTGNKLQFIHGGSVLVEWQLDSPRPFCKNCTNTFRLITCGPLKCDAPPSSTICVKPELPSQSLQCEQWPEPVELPTTMVVNISLTACGCAFPPPSTTLWLVEKENLRSGEVAAWQGGQFRWWVLADHIGDGDGCYDNYTHGYYVPMQPFSVRVVLRSNEGFGDCFYAQFILQIHTSEGECVPGNLIETARTGPNINTPEQLAALTLSEVFDAVGYPGCGPGAPAYGLPLCGWTTPPPYPYEMRVRPDHYATFSASFPPEP